MKGLMNKLMNRAFTRAPDDQMVRWPYILYHTRFDVDMHKNGPYVILGLGGRIRRCWRLLQWLLELPFLYNSRNARRGSYNYVISFADINTHISFFWQLNFCSVLVHFFGDILVTEVKMIGFLLLFLFTKLLSKIIIIIIKKLLDYHGLSLWEWHRKSFVEMAKRKKCSHNHEIPDNI